MTKKKVFSIGLGIFIVNLVIKAWNSSTPPFSYDEIISIKNTLLEFGHVKHEAEWDNNPPFYYYLLWIWHAILPISEFTSRILSALFLSAAVGLTFIFCHRLINLQVAGFSAANLTFSNILFFYGQEARVYALVVLLVVLSSILFFAFLSKPSNFLLGLLCILNFLLLYSHYLSAIIIFWQFLFLMLLYRLHLWRFCIFQGITLGVLVGWRFTKKQYLHIFNFDEGGDFWLKTATLDDLSIATNHLFYGAIASPLVISILFIAIATMIIKSKIEPFLIYCLFVSLGSILVFFIVGLFKPVFLDRYLIFTVPFATILVCHFFFILRRLGIIINIVFLVLVMQQYDGKKPAGVDFRLCARIIHNCKKENDKIIVHTKDNLMLFYYYFDRNAFIDYRNQQVWNKKFNVYPVNDVEELKQISFRPTENLFLIQSFHLLKSNRNVVKEFLSNSNQQLYSTGIGVGAELTVFRNL